MPPAASTRQKGKAKSRVVSSVGPDDSVSQAVYTRQANSTNSSRSSLVNSERHEDWISVKPYLESFEQETTALDKTDADNAAYKPQTCQRISLCRSIPELDARRRKIRALGYRVYGWPRPETNERYYPSKKIYDAFKTEF